MSISVYRFLSILTLAGAVISGCSKEAHEEHDDQHTEDARHEGELGGDESADAHEGHEDAAKEEHEGHEDDHEGHDEHDEEGGEVHLTKEAAQRITLRTELVTERELAAELETTGEVDFDQDHIAHVSPRLSGRVYASRAALGDVVKAGQTLAVIDSIDLGKAKAEYLQAKAQRDLSKQNLEREEKLAKEQISSEREVLEARAQDHTAASAYYAALETLRLFGLSKNEIKEIHYGDSRAALFSLRAPFDGKIVAKHLTQGELVTPEKNLFTVADLRKLWIWIDVYERDLQQVHIGDGARVRTAALGNRVFEGKVSYLRDEVNPNTRTVRARVDVNNADFALRPGMFVTVLLSDPHDESGKTRLDKALVVRESAVQRDGKGFIAFVQEGELEYALREVEVGRQVDGFVEIRQGLKLGEPVVVEGAFYLKAESKKDSMGGGHSH